MKRSFGIGLIAVGILLTTGATAWAYFNNRVEPTAVVSLPYSINGLQITAYRTGEEAIAEIENLHGKQFPISLGSIGVYGNHEITVWVAGAPSESIASQMTKTMEAKIAEGNSPFTPINEINDNDREVYVLEGMGQRHYYFQAKNLVIWLASDPVIADTAIQQILEVYP
ncbi:MAG TPA: hypothetical protein VFZ43_01820 [Anaerolineales bacterium]